MRTSISERVVENAQPAASSTSPVPVLADSAAIKDNTSDYLQLFANADESTRATLSWANEYLTDPDVAAWMQDCAKWRTAVTTGNYQNRKERRKLFKETDVPCTRACEQNADYALKVISKCLINRIQQIRANRKLIPTINKKARNQEPMLQDTASAAQPQETLHLQPRLP